MERGDDGNYRVTRDEQRLFKTAASLAMRNDLIKVYAHYLGVRRRSVFASAVVRIRKPEDALQEELKALPAMVEFEDDNRSIEDMKYIYTPHLAEESINTLRLVMHKHFVFPEEQAEALQVSADYDAIHGIQEAS